MATRGDAWAATGEGAVAINGAAARDKVLMPFRRLIPKSCSARPVAPARAGDIGSPSLRLHRQQHRLLRLHLLRLLGLAQSVPYRGNAAIAESGFKNSNISGKEKQLCR